MRSDDTVVLYSNRNGLRVPKRGSGRMTAAARIVIIQSRNCIEPQQPPDVGKLAVDGTSEARFKRRLNPSGKTRVRQCSCEFAVQFALLRANQEYSADAYYEYESGQNNDCLPLAFIHCSHPDILYLNQGLLGD